MEVERSFFDLASQRDEAAYHREAKALLKRRDTQLNNQEEGTPALKRARFSQDSAYSSQADPGPSAADGTIKSITLEDFMCHRHLYIEFNPKVNFLIGQNGSGKSAILTAITVGLGAQARETGRAKTLRGLVRQGEEKATITIELYNKKKRPHLNIHGNLVTVKRTISNTSQVQIKCQGRVVSTRMDFLHQLLKDMGIQINNPISVLDQDTSKTFLAQSTSTVKYELFMRATALEDIQIAYRDIRSKIGDLTHELDTKKRDLDTRQSGSKDLIKKYEQLEALYEHRRERGVLIGELLWSKVNLALSKLKENNKLLELADKEFRECKNKIDTENREETYADDLARLQQELDKLMENKVKLEKEIKDSKFELTELQSQLQQEEEDIKRINVRMKQAQRFITEYNKQIENEIALGEPRERALKQREAIRNLEKLVKELEAEIETKESSKFELQSTSTECDNEVRQLRMMKHDSEEKKNKIQRNIRSVSQDESNLSIYGDFMPALIKRIEAAASSFRKKPIGPLGLHVKLLDEAWGPSVEAVTGNFLTAFCVDNAEDYAKLKEIMRKVCHQAHQPTILKYKFVNQVHDVSRGSVVSPPYQNMMDVLKITNPMAANVLIDKCAIERILLIPDDKTCQSMLTRESSVPRNCLYAITLNGDTYYPAPMYRTYAGNSRRSVRYLKASKEAVIQNLKNDMAHAMEVLRNNEAQLRAAEERARAVRNNSIELDRALNALSNRLQQARRELRELSDQAEPEESTVAALRNELSIREQELEELEKNLQKYLEEKKTIKESFEKKKGVSRDLQIKWDGFKTEERKLKEEKDALEESRAKSLQERESSREILANLTDRIMDLEGEIKAVTEDLQKRKKDAEEFDDAQRELAKKENSASESRSKTRRKPTDVERDLKTVDNKIAALERGLGDNEGSVVRRYKELKKDIAKIEQILRKLVSTRDILITAMETRTKIYGAMMKMNRVAIDNTFRKVLRQRGYKGSLTFENSAMNINIGLSDGDSRSTSTLSGGERSFGTMALLIALWYVTKLPFYFMDEFDVFMDMANRETIMALMMDYTRKRNYQFCFLTPLNTSSIEAASDVTIHRLEPPRRRAQDQ